MIEKIYIVRHGYRLNWVTPIWKSATDTPRDPPLAAFGVAQSEELASYFLSLPEDQRPTAIFSSPYYRCLQTSQPTAIALKLPIYVEHGLSEWYSPVSPNTGLHPRPGPAKSLEVHFPEIDSDSWTSSWYPSRKGEDVAEVHERSIGFLNDFIPLVESCSKIGNHERVLFLSHAATVITLARGLVGDENLPIRVGCCSLTEVDRRIGESIAGTTSGAWEARKVADGSHMKEGASRDWGFEDIVIANGKVIDDVGQGEMGEVDEPVGSYRRASHL